MISHVSEVSLGETVESDYEEIITNEGLFILFIRNKPPGKDVQLTTYDPPRLRVPADITDGKHWTVKRHDGANPDVVLNTGSHSMRSFPRQPWFGQ